MPIDVHPNAEADLEAIAQTDPRAVAAVLVLLEELEAEPDVIDKLTTHGDVSVGASEINIKRWIAARRVKKDGELWRIRAIDTPATSFRIIYGYCWRDRRLCVLGIAHRDEFNYDFSTEIECRILDDWRAI